MFLKALGTMIACIFLLSGCMGGGSSPVRYYLVDPVETQGVIGDEEKPLAIEIIDVHLPQYLERFQIVSRGDGNQLKLSQNNQWGENLRKNLLRTLALNLAQRLSTIDIGTPLNRSASPPDYRIHVHIAKFERDSDGYVKLIARWQLIKGEGGESSMYAINLTSDGSPNESDYDRIVFAMQTLYGQLSQLIADSIIEMEETASE